MSEDICQEILLSRILTTNSFTTLQLSPNDWVMPTSDPISCVYFYNIQQWSLYKKQNHNTFMNVEKLIPSLQILLKYYPLLTGTFKVFDIDNKVSLENDENKGGILFISTVVNISLNELPTSTDQYTDTKKIPESLQLINAITSDVLFDVHHTRFSCGSVALGISLNHQIADAHSYFQLKIMMEVLMSF